MMDRFFVTLQRLLPHHLISRVTGWAARRRFKPFKNLLIGAFLRLYRINMSEAAITDPFAYPSFNDFFTRLLAPGARPLAGDAATLVSPVDGAVSQSGAIAAGQLLQAKGHEYAVDELLAAPGARFTSGHFATIYLAPYDYHRVHMPLAGTLHSMRYVPGRLYSVGDATTRILPGLFALNERVIFEFRNEQVGAFTLVMVGALNVGSVTTVHAGDVMPLADRKLRSWDYSEPVAFDRGDELARFNLGSTVILLFEPGSIDPAESLAPGTRLRLGQQIARVVT
ncbi:MAG: phosphatidylserine decarboxylase [Gammaproteobacteria bacterium]|nr:phosphatidylserine decarboxylase [Gammaproteobacteria bacterium]NND59524.1 phosphatidylserine decarboxylase [Gammaproteobacteria bacterium]